MRGHGLRHIGARGRLRHALEGPLEQVVDSITGPVARAAGVIAIVIAGVTIAFSEGGGGVRKLAWAGLGIAIMFAAVSWGLTFFGFAGGAMI